MDSFVMFSGTANQRLAQAIAAETRRTLGACTISRFPDGEVGLELNDTVVGRTVVLVQPTSPPVDEHLIELLALVDACRRGGAAHIIAVVPYFGYARADRRGDKLEPITASVVAQLFQAVGVDHLLTVDLHTPQIQGFFQIPLESLTAAPLLADALRPSLPQGTVVVSPDAGRVQMATKYAQQLETSVVVLHKERLSGTATRVTQVIGDVQGRSCLIIDDMISTGGTLVEAATALRQAGAAPDIFIAATHGLFVADARTRLAQAGLSRIWVSDTVDLAVRGWPELQVVAVAPLIAAALRRLLVPFDNQTIEEAGSKRV